MTEGNNMYKITKWANKDNYECLYCPYATLDKRLAVLHYLDKHLDEKKVERVSNESPAKEQPKKVKIAQASNEGVKSEKAIKNETITEVKNYGRKSRINGSGSPRGI
jgi:hypothetical protein